MDETKAQVRIVRFGDFEADLHTGELRKNATTLKFSGQPFQVLAILLERPGDVVTRAELQKRLWPDTFVDVERNLNTAVNKIRETLGDSAESPKYIETLPRRGYRFIAPIEACAPQLEQQSIEDAESKKPKGINFWWASALGLLTIGIAAAWYLLRPLPAPRITDYAQITLDGRHKEIAGTDGNRIFLNLEHSEADGAGLGVFQLSIADGNLVQIPLEIPGQNEVPSVRSVSPDGSSLLVRGRWTGDGNREVWVVGSMGRPARLLTRAEDETFSEDGKFVVYATANGDLYRIPTEGGPPSLIVRTSNGEAVVISDPAVSPDGRTIRFTSSGVGVGSGVIARRIWEVASNGSNLHEVLPGWQPSSVKCCGQWTADGAFFLFVAGPRFAGLDPTLFNVGTHLWAIDERRGRLRSPIAEPIQLASGPIRWGRPIPSRNGSKLFARGVTFRAELVRYDAWKHQMRPWLEGVSAISAYFSTDGKSMTYVTFPDGILWRANRDGSNPVQLTESALWPQLPRWSPDGKRILFTEFVPGFESAYVISVDGGTPQRLIPEVNDPQNDASWSPDGKKVIYCACGFLTVGPATPLEIRIFDIASRKITALPDSKTRYSPRWSPDGRYIAALHTFQDPARSNDLELFDLKTQRWNTLVRRAPDAGWPSWSRDGRYIYYHRESGVFRVPIDGGQPEQVVDLQRFRGTGLTDWMDLDPDGAPLLVHDLSSEEIYSLTLATN
jgi:Tol biopolymer transport system component/DNA-binding winged helix-turn-helix (wHTH) protein